MPTKVASGLEHLILNGGAHLQIDRNVCELVLELVPAVVLCFTYQLTACVVHIVVVVVDILVVVVVVVASLKHATQLH